MVFDVAAIMFAFEPFSLLVLYIMDHQEYHAGCLEVTTSPDLEGPFKHPQVAHTADCAPRNIFQWHVEGHFMRRTLAVPPMG